MKNVLIALMAVTLNLALVPSPPGDVKECKSIEHYVPPAQDSRGYWRSGYWTTIILCFDVIKIPENKPLN